uniref:Uncharacterized protein n=1 Tax=Anguilla anguilla TaxID=7936 RepID=A0A0E9PLK7_ANGAN
MKLVILKTKPQESPIKYFHKVIFPRKQLLYRHRLYPFYKTCLLSKRNLNHKQD